MINHYLNVKLDSDGTAITKVHANEISTTINEHYVTATYKAKTNYAFICDRSKLNLNIKQNRKFIEP